MIDIAEVRRGPVQRAAAGLAAGGLVLLGVMPAVHAAPGDTCTVVDFSGLAHGTVLAEQLAAQGVHVSARANEGRPDKVVIFDSNRTGTADPDLQVGAGNLAIIPENVTDENGDGLVDRPSDSIRGGTQVYTFDEPRTVKSFVIADIDHGLTSSHFAKAFGEGGSVLATVPIAIGADGNVQTVNVNAEGVRRLEITYRDSAGVTRLDLGCVSAPPVPITAAVVKTNDANGDTVFTDDETTTSEGASVTFRVTVTNTSSVPAVVTRVVDAVGGQQLTINPTPNPVGTTLAPGQSLTFHFTLAGYSPANGGSVVDTVTVDLAQATDASNTASASDTSVVRTVLPVAPPGGGGGGVVLPPSGGGGGVVTPPKRPVRGGGGGEPTLPTTGDATGQLLLAGLVLLVAGTAMTAGARMGVPMVIVPGTPRHLR